MHPELQSTTTLKQSGGFNVVADWCRVPILPWQLASGNYRLEVHTDQEDFWSILLHRTASTQTDSEAAWCEKQS